MIPSSPSLFFFGRLLLLLLCVLEFVCIYTHVFMAVAHTYFVCVWRPEIYPEYLSLVLSNYFKSRVSFSVNLELINSDRLDGQQAPAILLSVPFHYGDCRRDLLFLVLEAPILRSPSLLGVHLIGWTISPALWDLVLLT